ncbi:hypothetical protein BKA82DRAFT_1001843 [Pisolithus tinctorius]|uniref:Heterokaryon incompatibility domain-containing protein n=1 Tax=Pisolithus tinctorius Marx 270 TaxID=870435 RepID=A0A0C3P6G4_PISTI|nr:hypothetical protein BKA82DRAFT_1001843 [Pisolithus tinctorius]KIO02949.1 hypothetical protein M404DRAFT_1001843 [Pisolithus tinctorius Marx 270]
MPLPFVSEASCRDDINLKKQSHKARQRYMDPHTGQCTELVVQAVKPASGTNIKQVRITDQTRRIPKLVVSLFRPKSCSMMDVLVFILLWPFRFLICSIHLLIWPLDGLPKGGMGGSIDVTEYPPYLMCYWGHLWAARSQKEYTVFESGEERRKRAPSRAVSVANSITRLLRPRQKRKDDPPSMAPAITSTPESAPHSFYPSRLVILRDDVWEICDDHEKIARHHYFAVTYRQSDILESGRGEDEFIASIRSAASQCEMKAYWLDLECMGNTDEEKHLDVYQLADIYRGAEFTLVALPKSDDPTNAQSGEAWSNWSDRVWTLPEILLSKELRYMVGPKGPVAMVTLRELAVFAYGHDSEEAAVVNACGGMDRLYQLEHLTFLKAVIWRRGIAPQDPEKAPPKAQSRQSKGIDSLSYEAEKVYALMAFFEHRIMPFPPESDLHALARLSMINDGYRIAERMLSMFPQDIPSTSCWYADDDQYKAQFWDIEPEVQVAGVTDQGALVLDGCRAASIRWKDFPEVGVQTTESGFRQLVAKIAVFGIPGFYAFAVQWIPWLWISPAEVLAIALFGWATILLILGPFMIAYSISGRILFTQPFLVGVKGALKVEEASHYLYRAWLVRPRLAYTTSGSVLAKHAGEGDIREGDRTQYDEVKDLKRDDLYTLIDTSTGTLYYFTANRPPTVCLYTGREGGLGRFVLCSENCTANELHKETVLRMPSQIHRSMRSCGWLAIGCVEE